jgi:hypothetical protein
MRAPASVLTLIVAGIGRSSTSTSDDCPASATVFFSTGK